MIDYKSTLNLPQTKFLMRANLSKKEPIILNKWITDDLYELIRSKKINNKVFLLHDGPPYANGNIHLGHAVNKILKDIIIKSKTLSGFNAPYTPTWDCHGLPIEQQVEKIIYESKKKISKKEFRTKCREYATQQVSNQKKDFIRLGVIANWKNSYLTMNFDSEADIIRKLSKIVKNNYIYRAFKPVHWCIKCNSSLAEAELDYFPIESNTIFVKFKSVNISKICNTFNLELKCKNVYLIIWTTTPWSLPANQALSVNSDFEYQLIKTDHHTFIIAKKLINKVMLELQITTWTILSTTIGQNLELLEFYHPFLNKTIPVILSNHVNLETGTGIVHTAPDHGEDDFLACKKYNIKPINIIDDYGNYSSKIHNLFDNKNIFACNEIIINLLKQKNKLLHIKKILHQYPHCWRHKHPVFFRATPQWFINMKKNNLKEQILFQIKNTKWLPKWGQQRILSMLTNRPDWCISRQRTWGVPIPILVHKKTGELYPKTYSLMLQIAKLISSKGIQAWWDLNLYEMLGEESKEYTKNLDVLDVWFESGSINIHSIYKNTLFDHSQANLYLEGSDQYRGWFMSSLIISIAIKKIAPFHQVLTHGFTVDHLGFKMSKSIGNIVSPNYIINKFGADILRLWISSTNYFKEITISDLIIDRVTETYRKIRNTARFILSNIHDFDPKIDIISINHMILLDKWIIGKTKTLQKKIVQLYHDYKFHEIVHYLMQFCSVELGSFYLDIVKDRLYTTKRDSLPRKSCQTALFFIIHSFVRWIAPILSFTADEIWNFIPGKHSKYVFTEEWFNKLFYFPKNELLNLNDWDILIEVKQEVNKVLELSRKNKLIKNSLNALLLLYVEPKLCKKLKLLGNELKFMFITSKVIIKNYESAPINAYKSRTSYVFKIEVLPINKEKCQRCWHHVIKISNCSTNNICNRCIENISGKGEKRLFL